MTRDSLASHHDTEWARLPADIKAEARTLLLALDAWQVGQGKPLLAEVRAMHGEGPRSWPPPGFHFSGGMAVRNYLRTGKVIERPGYTYRDGKYRTLDGHDLDAPPDSLVVYDTHAAGIADDRLPSGNWDDYYIAALEYAAGVRVE